MVRPTPVMRTGCTRGRAFTLAELAVSTTVMTIVMAGFASAMLLATHAIPDVGSPLSTVIEAADVADEISSELRYARSVPEASAHAVEFTVADRNGDGEPEVIRYQWSGTPGDPLIRRYNGGSSVHVAENVHEFQLGYDFRTATRDGPPAQNESGETTLITFEATDQTSDFPVSNDEWIGECFDPTLPFNATGWRVTRIAFKAKRSTFGSGVTAVQLRTATDGTPTVKVADENLMYESLLPDSYQWQTFSFSNVPPRDPGQGMCLVLRHLSGTYSCIAEFQGAGVFHPDTNRVETTDHGASWTPEPNQAMPIYVYGTVMTPGEPTVIEVHYVTGVHLGLQIGEHATSRVDTAVQTFNVPEVTGS